MVKVTLKILANTLGISTATVSKALKDYPDINIETKRKVQKLAKSLNYVPNSFAQGLRGKETKIIGLLVPDLVHHFFFFFIKSVICEAEKHGYLVILLESYESYQDEARQLKSLVDKGIDGILLSLSDNTDRFDHINKIINNGTPVVLFDKTSQLINCPRVIIDDRKAAFNATEYLIKTGCTRIALIAGPLKPKTTIDRYKGYKNALAQYNIPFEKSLVYTSENHSYEDGYQLTEQIINDHPYLDGIFGYNDHVSIGALKRLNEYKIKVPDQVSVIGFSNWFMSNAATPTLTTVDQSTYEMGKKALELLLDNIMQIKKGVVPITESVKIPTQIIVRNSTRAIISEKVTSS